MKKPLLLLVLFASFCQAALAQDIITNRNGESLKAKVLEVSPSDIRYKLHESQEGPTYVLSKNDVLLIQYADNRKETFELDETKPILRPEPVAAATTGENLFIKGQTDADMHYEGYKGAGTGTLVASLFSPLLGLIPAIACSSSRPQEHNLDFPNHELMKAPDYNAGYKQRARKIKSGKVWKNWGIGLGVNVVAVILLSQ
ncbi:MAG: hypothetical protein LPK14_14080 [Hymenobacteraceae bacterium]|nr:hypothetical protein [Hymenobacteraceae bacterium]